MRGTSSDGNMAVFWQSLNGLCFEVDVSVVDDGVARFGPELDSVSGLLDGSGLVVLFGHFYNSATQGYRN